MLLLETADTIDDLGFEEVHGERVKHFVITVDDDTDLRAVEHSGFVVRLGRRDDDGRRRSRRCPRATAC